ncbi:MAG: hypothetical protein OEQ39_05255 [Gammaproteobacteria bacterium]|nr:hypothetical protein [Gammaproteobacteria bacterium]MDH3467002.1 hypothetical protein [Gammaproteobacteria bacterium]
MPESLEHNHSTTFYNVGIIVNLAVVRKNIGGRAGAPEYAEAVFKLDADDIEAHNVLVNLHGILGQHWEAFAAGSRASVRGREALRIQQHQTHDQYVVQSQ